MSTREFWCAAYLVALRQGNDHYARSCADAAVEALKQRTEANFEPPRKLPPDDDSTFENILGEDIRRGFVRPD